MLSRKLTYLCTGKQDKIIKLNSKWMALEAQIQKQFIWTTDKQLKEEKTVYLNREINSI